MKTILAILVSLIISGEVAADPNSLMRASCRITAANNQGANLGSGTIIKETETAYYILTCGHVTSKATSFYAEFFEDGYVSRKVPLSLLVSRYVEGTTIDTAVLLLNKGSVLNKKLPVIPLAPADFQVQFGQKIIGAGCPQGKWVQYWESRVNKNYGNAIGLNMSPVSGQSGSAIVVETDGVPCVIGIITWAVTEGPNAGGGVSISRIFENLYGNPAVDRVPVHYAVVADKVEKSDGKSWVVPKTTQGPYERRCTCGVLRKDHIKTTADGQLLCPLCKDHKLTYNQHLEKGYTLDQFCGPYGCFPRPQYPERPYAPPYNPNAPPYQPSPNLPLPGDLFPQKPPDQPQPNPQPQQPQQPIPGQPPQPAPGGPPVIPYSPPEKHPLDDISGGHGTAVQNTSMIALGALGGSYLFNTFGLPFLIRRTGRLPARLITLIGKRELNRIAKKKLGVGLDDLTANAVPPPNSASQPAVNVPQESLPPTGATAVDLKIPDITNLASTIESKVLKAVEAALAKKFPGLEKPIENIEKVVGPLVQSELNKVLPKSSFVQKVEGTVNHIGSEIKHLGDVYHHWVDKLNPQVNPAKPPESTQVVPSQTQVQPPSGLVGTIPEAVDFQATQGLSRSREFFNTPFQKKTPTPEMIMKVLGDIENQYKDDKTFNMKDMNEILRQRLKTFYGVE